MKPPRPDLARLRGGGEQPGGDGQGDVPGEGGAPLADVGDALTRRPDARSAPGRSPRSGRGDRHLHRGPGGAPVPALGPARRTSRCRSWSSSTSPPGFTAGLAAWLESVCPLRGQAWPGKTRCWPRGRSISPPTTATSVTASASWSRQRLPRSAASVPRGPSCSSRSPATSALRPSP